MYYLQVAGGVVVILITLFVVAGIAVARDDAKQRKLDQRVARIKRNAEIDKIPSLEDRIYHLEQHTRGGWYVV